MFKPIRSFKLTASVIKIFILALLLGTGSALFLMTPNPTEAAENQRIVEDPGLEAIVKQIHPEAVCGTGVCFNLEQSCPVTLIFTREIKAKDYGIDVVSLQEFLIAEKYMTRPKEVALGTFGPMTSSALLKYQKKKGLPATGVFDSASRNYFNSLAVSGDACFQHVRYDMLKFTMKSGVNKKTVAINLDNAGFTGPDKQNLCYSTSVKNSCLNINNVSSFSTLLPSRGDVTKLATYFKGIKTVFSDVSYVPTDISEIQLLEPNYKLVATTTVSTTQSKVRDTSTPVYDPYNPASNTGPKTYTYTVTSDYNTPITDADVYRAILAARIPISDDFLFGKWKMTQIDSVAQPTNTGEDLTITFAEKEDTVTIVGCNTYTAKLTVSNKVIQSYLLASGYRACDYYPRTIKEGDFVKAIRDGSEYQIKDDNTLIIRTSSAKTYQFGRE